MIPRPKKLDREGECLPCETGHCGQCLTAADITLEVVKLLAVHSEGSTGGNTVPSDSTLPGGRE